MKTYTFVISMFILAFFISCSHLKKNVVTEEFNKGLLAPELHVSTVTDSLLANYMLFETLTASFSGTYTSNDQTLPLKGFIRIHSGSFIWMSLTPVMGIELGRILFTTDSIKYIDRMKNEYFAENYSFMKKKFGFNLDYKSIEAILTNRFFVYPPNNTISSYYLVNNESIKVNTISAIGVFSDINMNHSVTFSDIKNYIISNNLNLPDNNQKIKFNYSDFELLNGKNFPNNIFINIQENNRASTIDFNYKNITLNKTLSKAFTIPENYKRIYFD